MKLEFEPQDFRPLIEQIVAETVSRLEAQKPQAGSQLAYTEAQAARLLGVKQHVLRDARLRGEIRASKIGSRIVYTSAALESFLQNNPWQ